MSRSSNPTNRGKIASMKLIVGLGNPGEKYKNNRHNAGFLVADALKTRISNEFLIFKSTNFMNESGEFVKNLMSQYPNISISDLYIVHDDLDIPLGKYKIQFGVGPKVHNGVASIEKEIGSKDFWRVRIGIHPVEKPGTRAKLGTGPVPQRKKISAAGFVLQNFTKTEEKIIQTVIPKIIDLLKLDVNRSQNHEV